jgi:hypothetical protein
MTILLDIAALAALLLALTFVPFLGLRAEARITRQLRAARAREEVEWTRPAPRTPVGPSAERRPARAGTVGLPGV